METMIEYNKVVDSYRKFKSPLLETLIKKMDTYGMTRCDEAEYTEAMAIRLCEHCKTNQVEEGRNAKEGLCRRCREVTQGRTEFEKRMEVWEDLLTKLNALSRGYRLSFPNQYGDITIIKYGLNGKIWTRIVETAMYSGYNSWRPSGHALRIETSSYNHKANKLKKGFNGKDVAENLDKRCTQFLKDIRAEQKAVIEAKKAKETREEKTKAAFPELDPDRTLYSGSSGHGRTYRSHNNIEFSLKGYTISTYNGEEYSLHKVKGLHPSQRIREIIEFLDNQKKELDIFLEGE